MKQHIGDFVERNMARIVAFVLLPVLLPVTTVVANWLQDALGLNLTGDQLTAYVIAIIVAVASAGWKWLEGRKEYDQAVAWAEGAVLRGDAGPSPEVDTGVTLPVDGEDGLEPGKAYDPAELDPADIDRHA